MTARGINPPIPPNANKDTTYSVKNTHNGHGKEMFFIKKVLILFVDVIAVSLMFFNLFGLSLVENNVRTCMSLHKNRCALNDPSRNTPSKSRKALCVHF